MKKKELIVIIVCLLIGFIWWQWPITGAKVMAKHNVPVDRITTVSTHPADVNETPQIIEIRPGNRQISEFLNNLKLRRALPKDTTKVQTYHHDIYSFYYVENDMRYEVKVVTEEWLVVNNSWYKII